MKLRELSVKERYLHNRDIFLSYMSLFTLVIICGFVSQLDLGDTKITVHSVLSVASIFDLFAVELFTLLIFGGLLLGGNFLIRIFLYIFSSLFIAIYCVQFASFYQGGEFLSRLAVDNMNHFDLMINQKTIKGVALLVATCLVLPILVESIPRKTPQTGYQYSVYIILIAVTVTLHQSYRWLPQHIKTTRESTSVGQLVAGDWDA